MAKPRSRNADIVPEKYPYFWNTESTLSIEEFVKKVTSRYTYLHDSNVYVTSINHLWFKMMERNL